MRRFLYYDEDSINSFLAQIEKGLLTKKGKEKEITDTVSSQLDTTADITGDLSANWHRGLIKGRYPNNRFRYRSNFKIGQKCSGKSIA